MKVVVKMSQAKVLAVGLAVPEFQLDQSTIKKYIEMLFSKEVRNLEKLLRVFDNAGIKTRYLARPLEWYAENHTFAESNRIYEAVTLELTERAVRQALDRANLDPGEIGAIVFVSSTGIATPTIDAKLISKLGLSPHLIRVPIWGLGCAGGAAGLARAAELARSLPGKAVLLVAAELCSLTFQRNDFSKANLVGTGLFADGAAAAILSAKGHGPVVLGSLSTLFSQSEDVMGWDVVETGLKVRFSRDIPTIVRENLPELMDVASLAWEIDQKDIQHFIVHPGGPKVIQAYVESLQLDPEQVKEAHQVLEQFGNMSSVSVLFVLERYLQNHSPTQQYGVILALGPGFSAEQVLFKW
jgi:alkylresorcinol/alkylpyrone synthase